MPVLGQQNPAQFIEDFFNGFTRELPHEIDAAQLIDRYYCPDVRQVSDGIEMDRDRLIAHVRPVRKNLRKYRYDVHEAVADGSRIAARLSIHAQLRKGTVISTDVFMFAEFDDAGRLRKSDQVTREITPIDAGELENLNLAGEPE